MEWSNIRMSKAEFERLQKEYMAAAIKTAEKAKTFEKSEETVTVNENTSKTDISVTHSADIAVMTKTTETVSETKSEPKLEIMPEPEKTNSLPDTDPEEDVFLPEDETENITLMLSATQNAKSGKPRDKPKLSGINQHKADCYAVCCVSQMVYPAQR